MKKHIPFLIALLLFTITGAYAQRSDIQYFRPYDKAGLHIFETSKEDTVVYDGFGLRIGANFTQQYQALRHRNTALPNIGSDGVDGNQLMEIGSGFNLATANLNIDAQLADGIRVSLVSYMSSRHHPEFWVKGGFLQIDKLPMLNSAFLDRIMETVTVKVGHFEINYGDAHFRRSDNGNTIWNPFVGNLILDAFTTEIGAEVYYQNKGFLAMIGATDGEIQGNVTRPNDRKPSVYYKLGYDKQLTDDLRVRLTGSMYRTTGSINNTLYRGDRAGSRYYMVMENTRATVAANAWSGHINPNFNDNVTAIMVNPFVKVKGLELFGTFERARGKANPTGGAQQEASDREWNQTAVEAVYRFLQDEQMFVTARYNTVSGRPLGFVSDVNVNRIQGGLGWFVTNNIALKGEYVVQNYNDYPGTSILNGGRFKGFILDATIGF